jgi:hypothetical protein
MNDKKVGIDLMFLTFPPFARILDPAFPHEKEESQTTP